MEETILTIIQTLGVPIALIAYYLFVERPRQEERQKYDNTRHDTLVDRIISSQTDCANKMNEAIREHTEVIRNLTIMIDRLEEKLK